MISIQHLSDNLDRYVQELEMRGGDGNLAKQAKASYEAWKTIRQQLDDLLQKKNQFNKEVVKLEGNLKKQAIDSMKSIAEEIKNLESKEREIKEDLESLVAKIPNLTWDGIPLGKSDQDNPVKQVWGQKPNFEFEPKAYYDLPWYPDFVDQKAGVKVMGSRGYFLRGQIAKFQKVLFDYAEEIIANSGFELFYVPLLLNEKVMTEIGNLPDFDGQLYQVPINENTNYFLIPSSEQSLMTYFTDQNLGKLENPILVYARTTCFRKESGSYGKDQQGILRVHQFEKIEIDALCRPEDNDAVFAKMGELNEKIYTSLGLHFRSVEVCTGDMPAKHYRQVDYEAWFPGENKFREICSNGSASNYQSRGLNTFYQDDSGKKQIAWSLNCTGMTFRTGLAILEQNQQLDGRVKIPEVLIEKFGSQYLG